MSDGSARIALVHFVDLGAVDFEAGLLLEELAVRAPALLPLVVVI